MLLDLPARLLPAGAAVQQHRGRLQRLQPHHCLPAAQALQKQRPDRPSQQGSAACSPFSKARAAEQLLRRLQHLLREARAGRGRTGVLQRRKRVEKLRPGAAAAAVLLQQATGGCDQRLQRAGGQLLVLAAQQLLQELLQAWCRRQSAAARCQPSLCHGQAKHQPSLGLVVLQRACVLQELLQQCVPGLLLQLGCRRHQQLLVGRGSCCHHLGVCMGAEGQQGGARLQVQLQQPVVRAGQVGPAQGAGHLLVQLQQCSCRSCRCGDGGRCCQGLLLEVEQHQAEPAQGVAALHLLRSQWRWLRRRRVQLEAADPAGDVLHG
jgi:hypothetical protein